MCAGEIGDTHVGCHGEGRVKIIFFDFTLVTCDECDFVFSDLDVVAGFEERLGYAYTVDFGAIAGLEVSDPPSAEGVSIAFGVASTYGGAFQFDISL